MDAIIKINALNQSFGNNIILENINLEVHKGEIIGFLGPSGSGKTTLVKNIVGMNTPTNGEVYVFDKKIPSLEVVKEIGYMAQSDALYEDLTAIDNLLFFAALYNLKGKEAKERANEVLSLVQLENHSKKLVHFFSGGMKRRLSLAIALIHNPKLLILDEPTVGIDPLLRQSFWLEFKRLKSLGVTLLITTHVMDEANHCDKLALIREGKIIALDSPEAIKKASNQDTIEEAFLYYSKASIS